MYIALFIRSLWMKSILYTDVNFLLALICSVFCYGVGWLYLRVTTDSSDEPYVFISHLKWREKVWIIRALTFMRFTQLTYINCFLLTGVIWAVTNDLHWVGVFAALGYYLVSRLIVLYLDTRRTEVLKEVYHLRPQCYENCRRQ